MNDISPFGSAGDVLADDLLLDRIAGRVDAGPEPVAGLLAAIARVRIRTDDASRV